MPIKFGEIQDAQLFVEDNEKYKPLGHLSEVELTVDEDAKCSEKYAHYFSSAPIEFTVKTTSDFRAFVIFATTGNDLYLRFPKKLRRKRRWTTKRDKN